MKKVSLAPEFPNYEVWEDGTVFNVKRQRSLKIRTGKGGNKKCCDVGIYDRNGKQKFLLLHRLLAQAFIPNLKNLPCVNHLDGNPENNNLSNLEWVTYSENNKHAYKTGLHVTGEDHHYAKLTKKDVFKIRERYNNEETVKEITQDYPISLRQTYNIIRNKSWKHD